MNQEEKYELFEGDIRKLDELISQLELWSDEYTINHKKEEVRLPEYVSLNENLEELKVQLQEFIDTEKLAGNTSIASYEESIQAKLEAYKPTEEVIHQWVREIKNIYTIVMKSPYLEKNKAYIDAILSNE